MLRKIRVLGLGLVVLVSLFGSRNVCADLDDGPWPMFHHDVQHTGQSPYNGPETAELKWRYLTGGDVWSSPAIASDGTIYVGSHDCYLRAINPDGTLKWRYQTGGDVYSSPAIASDGTVYVGSDDYYLYALNPDGTLKWRYQTGSYIPSSPAIDTAGTIYVGSYDNYLYALNPDGTLKWRCQTGGDVWSSPAIASDGTIYVGSHDCYLRAINPDGTLKWRYQTGWYVYSSPAIASDGTIYVGSHDRYLYALNPDGTLKWRYQTGSYIPSSPAIDTAGTIYVGSYDNYLYALNPDGTLKWRYLTGGGVWPSPAIASDGTIYFGSRDDYLRALNPDGTLKWRYQTGWYVYSSPAIASDGTIYAGSLDGYLYAIGPTWPPSPPTTLEAIPENEQVSLNWDAASGAAGYKVYYDTDSGEPYANSIDVGNVTSYVVTGLTNDATYYFAVTAYNDYGESDYSNEAVAVPTTGEGVVYVTLGGNPIAAASIYVKAQAPDADYVWIGQTDAYGYLRDVVLESGDEIRAEVKIADYAAAKHTEAEPLMWELWYDSDVMRTDGGYNACTISNPSLQQNIELAHPVFKWNLVIRAEYALGDDLANFIEDFKWASNYFYDVSDGQMKLGNVRIYDENYTQTFPTADYIIKNESGYQARANARWDLPIILTGIDSSWGWQNAKFGNDESYTTYIHEFGHYGLGFYDEYVNGNNMDGWNEKRTRPESFIDWELPFYHTGTFNHPPNYGLMDFQFYLPELSSKNDYLQNYAGYEGINWDKTGQLAKREKSCWDYLKEKFDGTYEDITVTLTSPDMGQQAGYLEPGTEAKPKGHSTGYEDREGPRPSWGDRDVGEDIEFFYNGAAYPAMAKYPASDAFSAQVKVKLNNQLIPNASVVLASANQKQTLIGKTNEKGEILVCGIKPDAILKAFYQKGNLSYEGTLKAKTAQDDLSIALSSKSKSRSLSDIAAPNLIVNVGLADNIENILSILITSDEELASPPTVIVYEEEEETTQEVTMAQVAEWQYSGACNVASALSGTIEITTQDLSENISHSIGPFEITNLYADIENTLCDYYGQRLLITQADAVTEEQRSLIYGATAACPLPLPSSTLISDVFSVNTSKQLTQLVSDAYINISYSEAVAQGKDETAFKIYKWDSAAEAWQELETTVSATDNTAFAFTNEMGVYAVFGQASSDVTAPSAITDLSAQTGEFAWQIDLSWTAPGDDAEVGAANAYFIRFNTEPITEGNWEASTLVGVAPTPEPFGTTQNLTLDMPDPDTTYYFAVKAQDEAGNTSNISNSPSANSFALDTDGDGMPDMWENSYTGLDPEVNDASGDLDADLLTNLEEYQNHTDPTDADTDNDGATDYQEVQAGSDPNDSTSYPAIPPENLQAEAGFEQVSLTWDASPGSLGYKVYYDIDSGEPYANSIDAGDVATYTVTNLENGATYYFAVTAYNEYGESSYSTEVSVTLVLFGDINDDGRITTTDALLCFQIALGLYTPTPEEEYRADVNQDGRVTTTDALWIFQEALGIPHDDRLLGGKGEPGENDYLEVSCLPTNQKDVIQLVVVINNQSYEISDFQFDIRFDPRAIQYTDGNYALGELTQGWPAVDDNLIKSGDARFAALNYNASIPAGSQGIIATFNFKAQCNLISLTPGSIKLTNLDGGISGFKIKYNRNPQGMDK